LNWKVGWTAENTNLVGLPLEVVSKVLLRHANLSTTQIYLGTISEADALHYMDTLHGK
jgi:site-specific recombinase XerD